MRAAKRYIKTVRRYLGLVLVFAILLGNMVTGSRVVKAEGDMDIDIQSSSDYNVLKELLEEKRKSYDEDGALVEVTVCELLGWDINDISTWKGITFEDGRITGISLNQSCWRNLKLDLTGFDKLEELYGIFTGFGEIVLKGCTSLKKITLSYNNIEALDISDCSSLEQLDVRYNRLESLVFGEHPDITRLICSGNYLDVDSDVGLLNALNQVEKNGGASDYDSQLCQKNAVYSQNDIQVIQKMLDTADNAKLLGWDPEDVTTWSGVEWKTVSGFNRIKKIDIDTKKLEGELDVCALEYLQTLRCSQNEFTSIDVSECKRLSALHCTSCKLTSLFIKGADSLLYLSCTGNYLQVDEIEEECLKIRDKEGSMVSYEKQYILAARSAFNEEECRELERFAGHAENNASLGWDMQQPGLASRISWVVKNGEYRVSEINFLGESISGELDLSKFTELKEICMIATDIEKVILPENMKELGEKTFMNCSKLQEIIFPDGLRVVGEKAIKGCGALVSITLPESVIELASDAFEGCGGLEEVVIKGNLDVLSHYAFCGCKKLKKVSFLGDAPSYTGEKVFLGTPDDMYIYYDPSKNGWNSAVWKAYNMVKLDTPPVTTPDVPGGITPAPDMPETTEKPDDTKKPDMTNEAAPSVQQSVSPESYNTSSESSTLPKTGGSKYQVHKVKISKYKVKQNTITVILKRDKQVTGYEIQYRKGKKGKFKLKQQKGWKKNEITLRGLKKNSCYYIKARAYKVVEGKKYYSAFTSSRRIKVG